MHRPPAVTRAGAARLARGRAFLHPVRMPLLRNAAPRGAAAHAPTAGRRQARATLLALVVALAVGCAVGGGERPLTDRERAAIAAEVERRLREATTLDGAGDPVARMLALYPDSGRVVSAAGGRLSTTRDSLDQAVTTFWTVVGRNMQRPEWRWGAMQVDVLGADAAVATAAYRVPHLTPDGRPHVIGGVWTAVFARRDGRWVVVQEHLSDADGEIGPVP